MRIAMALPALLLLAAAGHAGDVGFGKDLDPDRARAMLKDVRPGLLAVVRASSADRDAAVQAFLPGADAACEAWKRFRNPELKPLFVRLTESADWHTRHRALLALEYFRDPATLPAAWKQILHADRRVREKAAIACVKLWDPGAAGLLKASHRADIEEMARTETDPHARACFEALLRRMDGTLPVVRMTEEFTVRGEDGLVAAPYLDDWENRKTLAPGFVERINNRAGGPSAGKGPVAPAWTEPVAVSGKDEAPGVGVLAFGVTVDGGRFHVGQDYAACMDGAGLYAVADGVVKILWAGWDLGTLIVVEHRVGETGMGCSVYMHGGDTAFVNPGERVKSGQLLGTVGMGFSTENGGHSSQLHFALYGGPYQADHGIPLEPAKEGVKDWLDPKAWLPRWRDGRPPGADETAASLMERAGRLRRSGYPARALGVLASAEKARRGTAVGEEAAAAAKAWREDAAFRKAMAGEPAVEKAEEAAAKPGKFADPKVKKAFEALLAAYGTTDLGPRIREGLER
jgi:murein DD-endopeptidase MepM/ murein hydrolase activator NlpD